MLDIFKKNEKGFVASMMAIFALIFMAAIASGLSALIYNRQRISANITKSTQSYYAAEAGIEDALLRLKSDSQTPAVSYQLPVADAVANVVLPDIIGGSRAIVSQADNLGAVKKVQAVYSIDAEGVSFHYGVQAGEGGMQMANGSRIMGNIFSDGNITGSGTIDDNVIVAGNGRIEGVHVKGDALVYSCKNSIIDGSLTYVNGGTVENCSVSGQTLTQNQPVPVEPMPILPSQIQQWKDEAQEQIISGDVFVDSGQTITIGPAKITGSLSLNNNAVLKLTGTVYVAGSITASNGAAIRLDSSYGPLNGVILSDGIISVSNNAVLAGSGQANSYLLVLSTNSSNTAISVSNNAVGAIFYASAGGIMLSNNVRVREATGYKVILSNNAVVQYDSGLENSFFSAGPGGGWKVSSWEEK